MPANDTDILFLNIYFRVEAMFRHAAVRTLETNPLLQPFITASDLKRKTSERVVLHINKIPQFNELELYLLVIEELRQSIIELYGDCRILEGLEVEKTTDRFDLANSKTEEARGEGAPQSAEEWIGFHNSFQTLPPVQRSAMELAYYAGMGLKEISRLTGQPKPLVNAMLVDGRKQLQSLIFEKRLTKAQDQTPAKFANKPS